MIKLLIWVGLLYAGARFALKTLFRPMAPKENDVKGQRQEGGSDFDLGDVEDVKYRDVMPDGNEGDENDGDAPHA